MPEHSGTSRFGVFAKHWTPGAVKTRLAATIGAQDAAVLHRCFLSTLLARFSSTADERVLFFAPAEAQSEFLELSCSWLLYPQSDGDLGARMDNYFRRGFADGCGKVVLIGSDSPSLPLTFVEQAFQSLDEHPVVLGPSEDGGYYLIGARQTSPKVFEDVDWGSGNVLQQTTAQLQKHQIEFALLPSWYDVDHFSDLQRLAAELEVSDDSTLQALEQTIRPVLERAAESHDLKARGQS